MTDDPDPTAHHCPVCGRFTSGAPGLTEVSAEVWNWACSCGARGAEGY